jgi:NADH:ubiquinone oxidoreductase subunit D
MWSAQAQAEAEGLTLLVAENTTGYFGVYLNNTGQPKPYQARVRRGGRNVSLACFATAEEAALCIARSPEGHWGRRRRSGLQRRRR